jgi:hypothetical protein
MGERGEGGLLIAGFEGRLVHRKERGEWGRARWFPEKKGEVREEDDMRARVPEREGAAGGVGLVRAAAGLVLPRSAQWLPCFIFFFFFFFHFFVFCFVL